MTKQFLVLGAIVCVALLLVSCSDDDDGGMMGPVGIQTALTPLTNIEQAALMAEGWITCYMDLYNNDMTTLDSILADCNGANLGDCAQPSMSNGKI